MSDNDKTPVTTDESSNEDKIFFEWTTHPMKKRPMVAVLVTVFILVISVFVFLATSSKFFTLLTLIVLFGSTAKFYLPTKYMFTETQVWIKTTTHTLKKNWSDFRSYYPDRNGILLSPFIGPSRLENFRGMYLIFNDNKQQVLDVVKKHIAMEEEIDSESGETV